ncbi:MAG TPA: sporulation integral membrane protein YtvI [Syntrophomonas sp.]|nr:sporulation integral membrane protein YtvI [Syntrophomonas sp.]HRW11911.1 sporulation integral membrane protein YtvI [Syntrophomonas sp.]
MDQEIKKNLLLLLKTSSIVIAMFGLYLLLVYLFPVMGRILGYIPNLFLPFIFAILIAILVEPVVNFFETKLRFKRVLAVLTSLLLVIGGFVYLVSMLVTAIIKQLTTIYRATQSNADSMIADMIGTISEVRLIFLRLDLPLQIQNTLQSSLQQAIEWAQHLISAIINSLVTFVTLLPGLMIFLMIATVATFFIIKDRALIRSFVLHIIPPGMRDSGQDVLGKLIKAFVGFVKAYSILISITFILTLVAMKILNVQYALTLALIIALADILPVLGPGAIYVPWIIWEFISHHLAMGIALLAAYVIISAVRQFLEPKIVGDNIGLHPLVTLMSLYVGLKLGGVVGMIMGPVCVVIFIAIYRTGVLDRYDWRDTGE